MQTLYLDVYFLINLTVDVLSLYFASILSGLPISRGRLIVSSMVGAALAVGGLFLPDNVPLKLGFMLSGFSVITYLAAPKTNMRRRLRLTFSFIITEAVCGAAVGFIWDVFDRYLYDALSGIESPKLNRKLLVLSVSILIAIGVLKMIVTFFSDKLTGAEAKIELVFLDKSITLDAFVDSGNLAVDPMDMRPVMLLKRESAKMIFPDSIIELGDPDNLDKVTRKRIRLIPVSRGGETHVLMGVRPDAVRLINGDTKEELLLTVAIDKEGGTYGGFNALLPATALKNVR